ncbi:MAG: hypothetical protein ACPHVN_00055 [Luminiphilus sp.]
MSEGRKQVVPGGGQGLTMPEVSETPEQETTRHFMTREPVIGDAVQQTVDALQAGLIPDDVQKMLWDNMGPGIRREVISKEGSMDTMVISTFKSQMSLVDSMMKQMFQYDGTPVEGSEEAMGMSRKDLLSLWMKLNQMMTRDLPKVYTMERIMNLEESLGKVMEELLTEEQQAAVLERLSKMN